MEKTHLILKVKLQCPQVPGIDKAESAEWEEDRDTAHNVKEMTVIFLKCLIIIIIIVSYN